MKFFQLRPHAPRLHLRIAPWCLYNIGNNTTVAVSHAVALLKKDTGRSGENRASTDAVGDVPETKADVDDLMRDVGFRPATPIEEGVRRFAAWYREFHAQN